MVHKLPGCWCEVNLLLAKLWSLASHHVGGMGRGLGYNLGMVTFP